MNEPKCKYEDYLKKCLYCDKPALKRERSKTCGQPVCMVKNHKVINRQWHKKHPDYNKKYNKEWRERKQKQKEKEERYGHIT